VQPRSELHAVPGTPHFTSSFIGIIVDSGFRRALWVYYYCDATLSTYNFPPHERRAGRGGVVKRHLVWDVTTSVPMAAYEVCLNEVVKYLHWHGIF
jgi:hypothetical protein